ncbi:ATPase PAAT-like isoform X2 [Cynocephalus volans]|uniref:ATPase PAAT-like isoform X2 n=1 Tax=Cynocephalus volans TaxID=110931 RepID=UPI002FC8D6E0
METGTEDWGLTRRPTLASSWEAACGALTQSLLLSRAGLGAPDFDWEELLAPPAPGQDLVILKRSLSSQDENPCFLYLRCDPKGGEEIVSIGILSSARNMEVYLGEEYCGTSRGKNVCTVLDNSDHEKIILYKNYLKLEPATNVCKIKHCIPIEEQIQSVLGNTAYKHIIGLQSSSASGTLDKSSSTSFPFRTGLTFGNMTENLKAYIDKCPQPPGGGNTAYLDECKIVPQNHSLLENDLKNVVSSFLPKKASDNSNIPNSELLPFLQNLCSQVNHLHVGHNAEWQRNITKPSEAILGLGMEEQPVCSYLEKILSKSMELMEKKLTDYIDQRIYKLQEHIDDKIALLMDLLQNPSSPPTGMPLRLYDSGERLSNGER